VKAFLYARVSTGDQNEGMQLASMSEFARRRGWDVETFADVGWSGAKERRPVLDAMMAKVRKRECDVVLVWRFDRFARSVTHLVNALQEFKALGVQFVSVQENIDTTLPHGELLFHIFAAIAQFERALISERVRHGMRHAKSQGKHMGRKPLGLDAAQITALRAQGLPWREVAHRVKADESTVRKFMSGKRLSESLENGQ
jgi:DNA invertase Pin-like site-specific DNA recombinase